MVLEVPHKQGMFSMFFLYAARVGKFKMSDHVLYLKEEVDALPEQDKYIPYQEDDFMFIFSGDRHDNMSFLSDLYGAESSRIDSLCVCKQESRQLHDYFKYYDKIV